MVLRASVAACALAAALAVALRPPDEPHPPEIYRFPLMPTTRAPGASGLGVLELVPSPFGVAVSEDGHLVYDLEVTAERLPPLTSFGPGAGYVAWITSPDLARGRRLGPLGPDGRTQARLSSWNKFLVLVTAERDTAVGERRGPVVLQGRSPSGLVASFQSHELFNLIPH